MLPSAKKNTLPLVNCKEGKGKAVCKHDRFDKCLAMIFNGNVAACKTVTSYHISPIERVDDDTLIINDATATIVEKNHSVTVTGTFLVQFEEDILVNDTLYKVTGKVSSVVPQISKQFQLNVSAHSTQLTLPYLHKVHLRNLEKIRQFDADKVNNNEYAWYAFVLVVATVIPAGIIVMRRKCRGKPTIRRPNRPMNFDVENEIERIVRYIADHKQIRDESA